MSVGIFLLLMAPGILGEIPDTSGLPRKCADEDRDAQGRLIRQVGKDGFTTLYTYDQAGKLIRIEIGETGVRPKASWVHTFIYEGEELKAEVDCLGMEHSFCDSPPIDVGKGTALPTHRHGGRRR